MAKLRTKDPVATMAAETASMLKAVADRDRLTIIYSLRGGPKNVGQLAKILRAEIVNVSHHLGVLRKRKLVTFEKRGRFVSYSLNPDVYRDTAQGETLVLGNCKLLIGK